MFFTKSIYWHWSISPGRHLWCLELPLLDMRDGGEASTRAACYGRRWPASSPLQCTGSCQIQTKLKLERLSIKERHPQELHAMGRDQHLAQWLFANLKEMWNWNSKAFASRIMDLGLRRITNWGLRRTSVHKSSIAVYRGKGRPVSILSTIVYQLYQPYQLYQLYQL